MSEEFQTTCSSEIVEHESNGVKADEPIASSGTGEESMETQGEAESGGDGHFDEHKLFVGALNWETNEATLKEYFSKYGAVADINLKYDPVTKRSRGFAFVVFEDAEAVQRVMDEVPHTIDGRQVDAKKAIPHAIHQAMKNRTKKIFVGGVPTDMPEDAIRNYFQQFGEIEEVALVTDKGTQRRRGFCFVLFTNEDAVDKCTEQTFHDLSGHQVEVKRATPREQSTGPGRQEPRGGGGGRGNRGSYGGGGGGGGGWSPYGQYSYGGYAPPPYGGYGGYYDGGPYYQGGGGGYYGGGWGGGGGGGRQGYGSRYGPMRSNYSHGGSYHPYSR